MFSFNLKTLFKKKKKNNNFKFGIDADDDWHVILSFVFVLLFISLLWNGFVFFQARYLVSERFENPETKIDLIDQKSLEKVVNEYKNKGSKFEELKVIKPEVVDPAL